MVFSRFKRSKPSAAEQLLAGRWTCGSCNIEHGWPFDLAARKPDPWPNSDEYEHNGALRLDGDFLSEDFCVMEGKHFMIRAVLPIPVNGLEEHFGFGCWSTLSHKNFEKYVEGFDDGTQAEMGLCSGWLMNELAILAEGPEPIALWVEPRADRLRPLLWVQDDGHPLAKAQEEGIPPEQMLEIFRHYGHGPS